MKRREKEQKFMLKQKLFRRDAYKQYKTLKKHEKKSYEEIKKINFRKRKKVLEYAYANVEFYQELYKKYNFHPKQLKNPEDWKYVPIISKQMIKENTKKILSQNIPEKYLLKSSTGGSTGEPLTVFHDKRFPVETIGWRMLD